MVVVVLLIVVVDVHVYMMFQQSHVIKRDPKKKIHNFFTYHSIKYIRRDTANVLKMKMGLSHFYILPLTIQPSKNGNFYGS